MELIDNKCKMCKAEFKPGALTDGKCFKCEELWPGISSKDELKKDPIEKENEGRMQNVIIKEVERILSEYGIIHKCDCGNSFYKRSPAQKGCGNCKTDNKNTGETN